VTQGGVELGQLLGETEEGKSGADNFFVLTHYQILVAAALARKRKHPARLYVLTDYLDMQPELADSIRSAEVFETVVFYSERYEINEFYRELELCHYSRPSDIASALHRNFDGLYEEVFKECEPTDIGFVFNEMQHNYYFIESLFQSIVKVEDGYKSFPQESQTLRLTGKRRALYKIEGRGFPVLKSRSSKIKAIVVSEDSERIADEYRPLLRIVDLRALLLDTAVGMKDIVPRMFHFDKLPVSGDSLLVVTQPMARANYCSIREQYELYAKICREYGQGRYIVIKPHPADKVDYSGLERLGAVIWDKSFPLDLLNFTDIEFSVGVTFGSTALRDARYVKEAVYLFDPATFTIDDVRKAVSDYVGPLNQGISYCLDFSGDIGEIEATAKSILAMKNHQDLELLVITDPGKLAPPLPPDAPARVIVCEDNSPSGRWMAALAAATFDYVLFASPGFVYSPPLHLEAMERIGSSNYDCVVLGLQQFFNGKQIARRILGRTKLEMEPYFVENKVFLKEIVQDAVASNFLYSPGVEKLQFYLELITRCRYYGGIDSAFVQFSSDTSMLLNWPRTYDAYSFDEQEMTCRYLYGRYKATGEDPAYLEILVGMIFWLMYWSSQRPANRRRYDEFLRSDLVTDIAPKALDPLRLSSSYVKCDTGEVRVLIDRIRLIKILKSAKRLGVRRFTRLIGSRLFR